MAIYFNADEVLALGERIEQNGALFYRRAAAVVKDPKVSKRLYELAEWEGGHESLFKLLRTLLADEEKEAPTFDPNNEATLYVQEMADRHVFNSSADVAALFKGTESTAEILELAICFERDSIALFQGLVSLVPEKRGRDKVRLLVDEEIGHVAMLVREKHELKK